MDIVFRTTKLRNECDDFKLLKRRHKEQRAKLIRRRLDDLHAAETLEVMRRLPGRCHELSGNLKGQLSVDLDGPYRLLFEPAQDPVPAKPDGGLDWSRVTAIRVLGVEDTHD